MTLKATLETLDGLDPIIAKEYKEVKDDAGTRYVLDADGVEDVTGLKSALGKERKTAGDLSKVLRKLGLKNDEASINGLMERLGDKTIEEILDELSSKPGETSEAVTKALKPLQRQLGEKDEVIATQGSFIDRLVRENALKDILAKEEHSGNAVLLMPHLLQHTKTVEVDGVSGKEYGAQVIDPKTKEVRTKGGKEMTLEDLVEEFKTKPEFSDAFSGTGASGSGASSQRGAPRVPAGGGSGSRGGNAVERKRASGTYNAI